MVILPHFQIAVLALALASADPPSEKRTYQLVGTVVGIDGKPSGRKGSLVFLHGAITPFAAQAQIRLDGQFKFKSVPAGTYTMIVAVPAAGEMRRTVEVGPSFADSKGRVKLTFVFDRAGPIEETQVISAARLSVPTRAWQEYDRARECLSQQDVKGAVDAFRRAVEIAPQFVEAWNGLGVIAYQTKQFPRAEECFRQALRQDPEAYSPLVNLGGALMSQGRFEEALSVNQRAVKARPDDPLANSQLGQTYFFLERLDEAAEPLRQAKALDAGHFSNPQLYLAQIYARQNRIPAAIAEIEEFLRLHPDSDRAPKLRKTLESLKNP